MPRSHKLRQDLRATSQEILHITSGVSKANYLADRVLQLAVERCFITLGEVATLLLRHEPELVVELPELVQAKGLRNRVVHDYDHVDHEIVWRIVQEFMPDLLTRLTALDKS